MGSDVHIFEVRREIDEKEYKAGKRLGHLWARRRRPTLS